VAAAGLIFSEDILLPAHHPASLTLKSPIKLSISDSGAIGMFSSKVFAFAAGIAAIGACLSPVQASPMPVTTTDFTLTFETSPGVVVGTGTLDIANFQPGSTYTSSSGNVTTFSASFDNGTYVINLMNGFSDIEFSGNQISNITAAAGSNPSLTLTNDVDFQFFFNSDTPISLSGTVLIAEAVPEASTWAMMILGFLGLGVAFYRKNGAPRFS
jgi:hypothetical protein